MTATTLTLLLLLSQFALAEISSTYTSIELTASGTPTYTVPVESQTNFPACTYQCIEVTEDLGICPSPAQADCACQPEFRSATAACLAVTCNDAEYLRSFELGVQVCDPIYKASPSLLPSVSAAISSATKSALEVVTTRSADRLQDYPVCALRCLPNAFGRSGCNGFQDAECVCRCPIFNSVVGACQQVDCKGADLFILTIIVEKYCFDNAGGFFPPKPDKCRNTCKPKPPHPKHTPPPSAPRPIPPHRLR